MRFYFDFLSHNEEIRDCEGVGLADWLTAHRHAVQIVKQTVPFLPKGLEPFRKELKSRESLVIP